MENGLSKLPFFADKNPRPPTPLSSKLPKKARDPRIGEHAVNVRNKDKDITISGYQNLEEIRKTVKPLGRVVSCLRLTEQEKVGLADLCYAKKRMGFKTSETQIIRVALCMLLAEHGALKKESTLSKVLEMLNA